MAKQPSGAEFKSLLIESIVIIFSILIAFALDAWWDGRQARSVEQAHIEALTTDFKETQQRLRQTIKHEEHAIELARQLAGGSNSASVVTGMLDSMLYELLSPPTFEPVLGAYQELLSSGELALIRNKPLRTVLAGWGSRVANYKTRERWAYELWNRFNAPYLMQEMSLLQIMPGWMLENPPANPFPRDHTALLNDPYFNNIVVHRWVAASEILTSLNQLLEANQSILDELQGRLEE